MLRVTLLDYADATDPAARRLGRRLAWFALCFATLATVGMTWRRLSAADSAAVGGWAFTPNGWDALILILTAALCGGASGLLRGSRRATRVAARCFGTFVAFVIAASSVEAAQSYQEWRHLAQLTSNVAYVVERYLLAAGFLLFVSCQQGRRRERSVLRWACLAAAVVAAGHTLLEGTFPLSIFTPTDATWGEWWRRYAAEPQVAAALVGLPTVTVAAAL